MKTDQAVSAGEQYAADQIQSDYFMDWVREQMLEASRASPSEMLPLETKRDALVIAKNMLQQLEQDTKHGVHESREFFEGFRKGCDTFQDQLADELLEIKMEMRGGGRVSEARASSKLQGMKRVADMTEDELVATIRACELRLNGQSRGISAALRESLISRIENCRAELMTREYRKRHGLGEARRHPKARRSEPRRR